MGTEEVIYTPLQMLYWKIKQIPCAPYADMVSAGISCHRKFSEKLPSKAAWGQLPSSTELCTELASGVEFHQTLCTICLFAGVQWNLREGIMDLCY